MALEHSELTGAQLHEPKGVESASEGEVYVADGAGSGTWQDPLTDLHSVNEYALQTRIDDLAAPSSAYVSVPWKSQLMMLDVLLYGTLDADTEISIYIDGVLFADSLSIVASGSGAGQRHSLTVTTANTIDANDVVTITTDGAATGSVQGDVLLKLERLP